MPSITGQAVLMKLQSAQQGAEAASSTIPVSTETISSVSTQAVANSGQNLELFIGLMQQQNDHIANQIMLLQQSHNDLQWFISVVLTIVMGIVSVGGYFIAMFFSRRNREYLNQSQEKNFYRWFKAEQADEENMWYGDFERLASIVGKNHTVPLKKQHQIDEIPADKIKSPEKDKK
ncbi:MAG: hypothetical protein OXQ96_07690 [Alphaproteobacteria bacterium]|nr:hypothetical protein [Alphaproteobacteria bacterium]